MPWKMILFLILLVILGVFAAFNLENRSDISLGFVVYENVPVFLSLMLAFVAGSLFTIPFLMGARRKQKKKLADAARAPRLSAQEPEDEPGPFERKP